MLSLTPRPAANEKPTNPKSKGVKSDLGSKKLNSSVACRHKVPASSVIAEFLGIIFLNSLNNPDG